MVPTIRNARFKVDDIVPLEGANGRFYLMVRFLLVTVYLHKDQMRPVRAEFARPSDEWSDAQKNDIGEVRLIEDVKGVKSTVLIGCPIHSGAFTEEVAKAMAEGVERPILIPLSSRVYRLVEVDAKLAIEWMGGKALLATRSPFPPAKMPNGKEYIIPECTSTCPVASLSSHCILITTPQMLSLFEIMLRLGRRSLPDSNRRHDPRRSPPSDFPLPRAQRPGKRALPDITATPEVNFEVASAVIEHSIEEGVAEVDLGVDLVRSRVKARVWAPVYPRYEYDPEAGAEWAADWVEFYRTMTLSA
ncbi:NAD(P)-binding protein [Peniophora sp. CONT]|nr:NAD(P)-binding protein [Peniophora sp. CONT]